MKYANWRAESAVEGSTRIFTHYIQLILSRAGVKQDSDIEAEIYEAVEDIVHAAVIETIARLEKDGRLVKEDSK